MNSHKIIIALLSILIVLAVANLAVLIAGPSMYSESLETAQTINKVQGDEKVKMQLEQFKQRTLYQRTGQFIKIQHTLIKLLTQTVGQ